ncbi:MAG: sugar/nucleoside kinase (ribokinase family) [Candidatus Latescibacterota bacterium]|jgi:sugar/nucleoside kinase (ribokinase family)
MENSNTMGRVLCYGVLGVDQLVQIAHLPEQDGHTRVFQDEEFIGGEAANTATVLSDLGVDVRLMGNALGDDRRGAFFLRAIQAYGVDARGIDVDLSVRTGHAIVLSDSDGARSICGFFPDLRSRALTKDDLEGTALLSVDPFLGENAVAAAKLAREMGVAVFAIELSPEHPLAAYCDVVINSAGFMRRHKMGDPSDVAVGLLKAGVETVVVTLGASGCRVFQDNGSSFDQAAYPIEVCDTTGAGDGFRAGLIYGYLRGWTLTRSVQFACGAGALACTEIGGAGHGIHEDQIARLIC